MVTANSNKMHEWLKFPKTFNFPWQSESGFLGYPCDIVFYLSSMTNASKPGLIRQVLDGQFPWLIVTSQDSDGIMGNFPGLSWCCGILMDYGEVSLAYLNVMRFWWDNGGVSLAYLDFVGFWWIMGEFSWLFFVTSWDWWDYLAYPYLSGFWLNYGGVSWILMGFPWLNLTSCEYSDGANEVLMISRETQFKSIFGFLQA